MEAEGTEEEGRGEEVVGMEAEAGGRGGEVMRVRRFLYQGPQTGCYWGTSPLMPRPACTVELPRHCQ